MSGRRVPLGSLTNAVNAMPQAAIGVNGIKRGRPATGDQPGSPLYDGPPAKRVMVDTVGLAQAKNVSALKLNGLAHLAPTQRRLDTLRSTKHSSHQATMTSADHNAAATEQAVSNDTLETIRQWQKHYRKAFPQYVFFFDNVPERDRSKALGHVLSLGAREEKFFSKAVTHIVTTRQIPSESEAHGAAESRAPFQAAVSIQDSAASRTTINPTLLQWHAGGASNTSTTQIRSIRDPQAVGKALQPSNVSNADILVKARELGIKIWAFEKFQRMMHTMFSAETTQQPAAVRCTAAKDREAKVPREDLELSQLLRNEKSRGAVDRDYALAMQDLAHFRGYYIYVHDMNEQTRPTIIRDYPKPTIKEHGKWPQFRNTTAGKCPFVEDVESSCQRLETRERIKAAQNQGIPDTTTRTGRAPRTDIRPLGEADANVVRKPGCAPDDGTPHAGLSRQGAVQAGGNTEEEEYNAPPLFDSAQVKQRCMPRLAGGVPLASGIQQSNVTSAIRSQMISSTAPSAAGMRVGTTKEVQQLNRRVFEKSMGPPAGSASRSYQNDNRSLPNGNDTFMTLPRRSRRRADQTVVEIHEDAAPQPESTALKISSKLIQRAAAHAEAVPQKRKDLRPGYCENCQDKFDDFDAHVLSRKHRKFAITRDNWADLDSLLSKLAGTVH